MKLQDLYESEDLWYHGSTDALVTGAWLKPGLDAAVWLTKDLKRAKRYAKLAADKHGGTPIVFTVLSADAPQDPDNFGDDFTRVVAHKVKIHGKIVGV